MLRSITLLAMLVAAPLFAQEIRNSVVPAIGVPAVASVGDTVYEKSHLSVLPAYTINEFFSGKNMFATVTISPGDKFIKIPSKSILKACRSPSIEAFVHKQYDACLYDDDGDGTFDRFGANEVQGGKKFPHPIPYRNSEFIQATSDSVKQVVIFLGSTKDSMRLSYREFVNDMARPAFTEEYSFPLAATFPQPIAFKGVKMSVTQIDGEGLHYKVISTPAD
jgi:hypothetical protein